MSGSSHSRSQSKKQRGVVKSAGVEMAKVEAVNGQVKVSGIFRLAIDQISKVLTPSPDTSFYGSTKCLDSYPYTH